MTDLSFEDEHGVCDVDGEWKVDVETCDCGITRCAEHREEGCPRCGREPEWMKGWRLA